MRWEHILVDRPQFNQEVYMDLLMDSEAKAQLVELKGPGGRPVRLGVIDLPSFYTSFPVGNGGRATTPKSTTRPTVSSASASTPGTTTRTASARRSPAHHRGWLRHRKESRERSPPPTRCRSCNPIQHWSRSR
jgi:hypothetical protein